MVERSHCRVNLCKVEKEIMFVLCIMVLQNSLEVSIAYSAEFRG